MVLLILLFCVGCKEAKQNSNAFEKEKEENSSEKFVEPIDPNAPPPPPPPPKGYYEPKRSGPRFPGCESLDLNNKELEECSKDKMLSYINENIVHPEEAKKKGTECMVVVQFYIDQSGELQNLKLVRDIGDGCGKAALKVLTKMKKEVRWIPGSEQGRFIKVQYTLPVKFKL